MRRVRLDPDWAAPALAAMPPAVKRRMKEALSSLAEDPSGREAGLDVKRLRLPGHPPAYRLRIGQWRACWLLRTSSVDVLRIFHRSEGYGWLERAYPGETETH